MNLFQSPPRSVLCLALLALLGCGGGDEGPPRPETAPVSGVVTYKGAGVEGATVSFSPVAKENRAAFGKTDKDGKFELKTPPDVEGAMPGQYAVSVTKMEAPPTQSTGSIDDGTYVPPAENEKPVEPKHLLPQKYANPRTSGFTATVPEDGVADLKFELTD